MKLDLSGLTKRSLEIARKRADKARDDARQKRRQSFAAPKSANVVFANFAQKKAG